MTLRVLDPGLYTLVVDLGRPHHRSLGVPVGGAADRTALILGNALVGNPAGAAALEINLAGPTLESTCDLACVVYGAPYELTGGDQESETGRTFTLFAGERLHIGGTEVGMRAYLCIRGGLQTPFILGSRSAFEPVRAGTKLPCLPGVMRSRSLHHLFEWERERRTYEDLLGMGRRLRVLDGPQASWFAPAHAFPEDDLTVPPPSFSVTSESNRMGIRLRGEPLSWPERELISEPASPGSVQVTRDGQCILLGVDGQTIGGYPKIAQVISTDLDLLGQLRPGDQVFFLRVSLEEAEALHRKKQIEVNEWLTRLRVSLDG
jgi:5-oxoprolinase (ATP-hydrolysing) subunit C